MASSTEGGLLDGEPPFLALPLVEAVVADARRRGDLMAGEHSFLAAWRVAKGVPGDLPTTMRMRRMGFLLSWRRAPKEPWFVGKKGVPTRRHLACVLWAFSPVPERLATLIPGVEVPVPFAPET